MVSILRRGSRSRGNRHHLNRRRQSSKSPRDLKSSRRRRLKISKSCKRIEKCSIAKRKEPESDQCLFRLPQIPGASELLLGVDCGQRLDFFRFDQNTEQRILPQLFCRSIAT